MTKQAYTYDEFDEILRGDGRNDNIRISSIDGLIAALVAGPAFVPPQQWLPLIFAGRLPAVVADTPEHLAVNTIFARYNEVSTILAESPQAYRPMFITDAGRIIAGHWAAGFVRGVALRPEAWSEILMTDMRTKLTPIFVSHEVGAGFLPDVPRAEQLRLRPDAHRHIAEAVVGLRAVCNPLRAATFELSRTRRTRRR